MENQEDNTCTQGTRDEKGRWVSGVSGNPAGRPDLKGWQPYALRLKRFLEMTFIELMEIYNSPEKMANLSTIDLGAIHQAINIAEGKSPLTERELALDRIEGKSVQINQLANADGTNISPTIIVQGVEPLNDNPDTE